MTFDQLIILSPTLLQWHIAAAWTQLGTHLPMSVLWSLLKKEGIERQAI